MSMIDTASERSVGKNGTVLEPEGFARVYMEKRAKAIKYIEWFNSGGFPPRAQVYKVVSRKDEQPVWDYGA